MFAFQFVVAREVLRYSTAIRWHSMGPHDFCDLELDIRQVQVPGLSPRELPEDLSLFVCSDEKKG